MPPEVPALTFLQFRVQSSNKVKEGRTKPKPKERALRALIKWKSTDLTRMLSYSHAHLVPTVLHSSTVWMPKWLP